MNPVTSDDNVIPKDEFISLPAADTGKKGDIVFWATISSH